jgi:hypothetical protein
MLRLKAGRPADKIGIAFVSDAISKDHWTSNSAATVSFSATAR